MYNLSIIFILNTDISISINHSFWFQRNVVRLPERCTNAKVSQIIIGNISEYIDFVDGK
jgi:hypothetical protein